MAAVRLYVTLAVLLLAACFHTSDAIWWGLDNRPKMCTKVDCSWLPWSSWGPCNSYCNYYNMQRRTREQTSSFCGGSACSGPSKQIRFYSCDHKHSMILPDGVVASFPCQCC